MWVAWRCGKLKNFIMCERINGLRVPDVQGVCTSHAMDGCQDCTSVGRTNFKSCPELFNTYSKLCVCESSCGAAKSYSCWRLPAWP